MKVCIIGNCGHADRVLKAAVKSAADTKTEAESGAQSAAFEVAGIAPAYEGDPSAAKMAARFAEQGFSVPVYENWREMLLKIRPEIAVVDGRFGEHAEQAAFCLRQGMHVFCDKPAAVNEEQLLLIRDAAAESSGLYWSMLTSRYDPWFAAAKRIVDAGTIGSVRLMDGQKSYKLGTRAPFYRVPELYGGTLSWVGIHMIDLMLWISGKKCVRAAAFSSSAVGGGTCGELNPETTQCPETTVVFQMELEDEILCSVRTDYLRPAFAATHGDDRIRIVGTKGSVEVRNERVCLLTADCPEGTELPCSEEPLIFEDFVAAAADGQALRISSEDSLEVTQTALLCTRALKERRVAEAGEELKI